ncbi:unnamed protein product, partial [Prorocentrum cordatum]
GTRRGSGRRRPVRGAARGGRCEEEEEEVDAAGCFFVRLADRCRSQLATECCRQSRCGSGKHRVVCLVGVAQMPRSWYGQHITFRLAAHRYARRAATRVQGRLFATLWQQRAR